MEARWTFRPKPDEEKVRRLVEEIHVPDIIIAILVARNIETYDKAKSFFRPSLQALYNPFLMHDMEKAVERIVRLQAHKERILVFGDYDVDGTNSASMLYLFLKGIGCDVAVYIPDRMTEGYGISETGIDYATQHDISLILAVDCGITAVSQVEYAKKKNIDVIICDHHEPAEVLPDAYAVLDPIKPGCTYPFKYLSGCGVAFKLIQGLAEYYSIREVPYEYLDFVAIAAAADIVPLIDENRILVNHGLKIINEHPRSGIKLLMQTSGLSYGNLTAQQIVFVMAPRINAVGRLGDANRAVELLTSDNDKQAMECALVLEEENRNRRKIDEDTFIHAQTLAEQFLSDTSEQFIILHDPQWHPGVIGIVASRLVEKYYRPAIMLTTIDGIAKGSARSIPGFNIYEALKQCEADLIQFGGHKYAAGLAIEVSKIPDFIKHFQEITKTLLSESLLTPEIVIDGEIRLSDITPRFFRILKQFAPFGPGNMRPLFLSREVEVFGTSRIVGRDHLKLKVRQDAVVFDVIGFNMGSHLEFTNVPNTKVDIVFSIEENSWNGNVFPQLKLRDLRSVSDERTEKELFPKELIHTVNSIAISEGIDTQNIS